MRFLNRKEVPSVTLKNIYGDTSDQLVLTVCTTAYFMVMVSKVILLLLLVK